MSSPEPTEIPNSPSELSYRSIKEAGNCASLQLPGMSSRKGADRDINIRSLNLLSGGAPVVYQQYNVYPPQTLEVHMT